MYPTNKEKTFLKSQLHLLGFTEYRTPLPSLVGDIDGIFPPTFQWPIESGELNSTWLTAVFLVLFGALNQVYLVEPRQLDEMVNMVFLLLTFKNKYLLSSHAQCYSLKSLHLSLRYWWSDLTRYFMFVISFLLCYFGQRLWNKVIFNLAVNKLSTDET